MLNLILALSVSFLLSLLLTPCMMLIAKKRNIVDMPDSRKAHGTPTPLLGGIAVCIATLISVVLFAKTTDVYSLPVLIVASIGVSFMGLIDDILSLSAKRRMIILFIISLIVFFGFLMFYLNGSLLLQNSLLLNILFSIFIIFWVVGVTNAINFSDGLDGLASYLSLVSVIAFAVIFSIQGRDLLAFPISLALFGAIAGFLPYNRGPALIFMGDAGSMFIGFMLSLLSIACISLESTPLAVVVPIFILFVPIIDMSMSILRRIVIRKPIMKPDNMHFHHKLNQYLNNHLFVAIILALIQIGCAVFGVFVFIYKIYIIGWIVLAALILILAVYTIISARRYKRKIESEEIELLGEKNSKAKLKLPFKKFFMSKKSQQSKE